MEFTLPALLAVFSLLTITSGVYFLSKRIRVPYTVLLVGIGALVLVPLSMFPLFSFLREFYFTSELLFYIFLPVLIFESAYNIDTRRMAENVIAVTTLAVVGLLVSAFLVAFGLWYLLPLVGLQVPFMACLLFGALISATDPVAVLALFKDFGAPRRLTLLFEGESIFNDGTAVALFFIILAIISEGFLGLQTILSGISTFLVMVLGGGVFGLLVGYLFTRALGASKSSEFVQITLMLVMAHLTFILTEFIATQVEVFGQPIHLSAIIATAVASMVLGNYGRAKITPQAEEFVEKFWTQSAFLTNSLVFILIGLIFSNLSIPFMILILPLLISVVVVALARALSVYPLLRLLNRFGLEEKIPNTWQHLLAWGSLRGALAITMALLVPETLVIAGWHEVFTFQEFIVGLTIGCIFATLFIKATTIEWLMRKLAVNELTDIERLEFDEARALIHRRVLSKLDELAERRHVNVTAIQRLTTEHTERMRISGEAVRARLKGKLAQATTGLGERVLRMYVIGYEKQMLKRLYTYGEVNEKVFRRIMRKLSLQYDAYDYGKEMDNVLASDNTTDIFEKVADWLRARTHNNMLSTQDAYMYHRTQSILSRAVLSELHNLDARGDSSLFGEGVLHRVRNTYESFTLGSTAKMEHIYDTLPEVCEAEGERLARHSILEIEARTLQELYEREMITPKIHIALRNELEEQAEEVLQLDDARKAKS